MNRHPVFYTKSDFFNLPNDASSDVNAYLADMSKLRYVETYEANNNYSFILMMEKMREFVGNVSDKTFQDELSKALDAVEAEFNSVMEESGYGLDFAMTPERAHQIEKVVEKLQIVHDKSRDEVDKYDCPLSVADVVQVERVASVSNTAYLVLLGFQKDLTRHYQFPSESVYEPVTDIEDKTYRHVDEVTGTEVESKLRTAKIGEVLISLEVVKSTTPDGVVNVEENWKVNDKALRAGKLPHKVNVVIDPSASGDAPVFRHSSGITLLEGDYQKAFKEGDAKIPKTTEGNERSFLRYKTESVGREMLGREQGRSFEMGLM